MTATGEGAIRAWLDDVWGRAEAAALLAGGDTAEPLARREVLAEVYDPAALAALRRLTTEGVFASDICRCPGGATLVLLDVDGEFIARASLHGPDTIAWERARFRNNLDLADPDGLRRRLERIGVRSV
ncbi:hypothetical protein ABZY90_33150 [Streptomyces sp. NPDC006422]|uniref:hypothetical protein n=1 Tax=unclassified Streptomyces TaxID=2593676 RepID=UPI0033BC7435